LPENDKNMEFQIPYITGHERAKATGPVNLDALGEVIDGYVPGWNPDPDAEDVGEAQRQAWRRATALIKRMEAQLRFQHEVLAEIHELTGARIEAPADRPRPDQGQGSSCAPAGGKVRAADVKPPTLHALASAVAEKPQRRILAGVAIAGCRGTGTAGRRKLPASEKTARQEEKMSVHDDGGPAYPVVELDPVTGRPVDQYTGITIRDWFAGQFLSTYVADGIPKAEKIAMRLATKWQTQCSQRGPSDDTGTATRGPSADQHIAAVWALPRSQDGPRHRAAHPLADDRGRHRVSGRVEQDARRRRCVSRSGTLTHASDLENHLER
jgi:hypothetical protein